MIKDEALRCKYCNALLTEREELLYGNCCHNHVYDEQELFVVDDEKQLDDDPEELDFN